MYDKKNSVLFTKTKCIVLSSDFKFPDDNHVLLRVLRENNMYNVDLKNIVPSGDLTCLFANATLDESNLWHRRLGHINFKTVNKLVKGKFNGKADEGFLVGYSSMNYQPVVVGNQPNLSAGIQEHCDAGKAGEGNVQQYVLLPLWSTGSKDRQNTDADTTFEVKEPEFKVHEPKLDEKKPESEVNISPSSSAQSRKQDDKTKRETKGKSHVESFTRNRDLSTEFEDCTDNNINEVNAAGTLVPTIG
nr:ribonuclease H-like domain-containing protein [Tanacetum cinerariifolium]